MMNTKYILFDNSNNNEDVKLYLEDKENVITINEPSERYGVTELNPHHYKTSYHYNTIIKYFIDDFDISLFNKLEYSEDGLDFSYLLPKNPRNYKITIYHDDDIFVFYGTDDILRNTDSKFEKGELSTGYHKLFIASHRVCHIQNFSNPDGPKYIIYGDSHVIPDLPLIAYYCSDLVFIDFRNGSQAKYITKNIKYDKTFVVLFNNQEIHNIIRYKLIDYFTIFRKLIKQDSTWSIGNNLKEYLISILDSGKIKTVLELGSGVSTEIFKSHKECESTTIEHNPKYYGDIYLPIKKIYVNGLSSNVYLGLQDEIYGKKYDLVLVDGPFGFNVEISRVDVLDIIRNNVKPGSIVILDDTNRIQEQKTIDLIKLQFNNISIDRKKDGNRCFDVIRIL